MPDKPERSLVQCAIGGVGEFFQWVYDTLSDDDVRAQVIGDLGLDPASATGRPDPNAKTSLDSIVRYRGTVNADAEAFAEAISDLKTLAAGIQGVAEAARVGTDETTEELLHRIFQLLSTHYLRVRFPLVYWFGQLAGFVEESFSIDRMPNRRGWADYLNEPIHTLAEVYRDAWPIETEAQAKTLSDATLAPFGVLVGFWQQTFFKGLKKAHLHVELPVSQVLYGWEGGFGSPTPIGDRLASRMLSFTFDGFPTFTEPAPPANPCTTPTDPPRTLDGRASFGAAWMPREHGGPGLFVTVGGSETLSLPLTDGWIFRAELGSASALDFLIRDWTRIDVGGPSDASLALIVERAPDGDGPFVFTLGDGVRLESEAISCILRLATDGPSVGLLARNSALIVETDSDAVLSRAASTERLRVEFDLGIGFKNGKFYLEGGSDLHALIPVSKSAGPLTIQTVNVELAPSGEPNKPDLRLELSATLLIRLGPITFTVDRIGLAAAMDFWDAPDLGFKSPTGVGVAIDSDLVSGGGYLFYDKDRAQYGGVLDLELKELFTLKAIGLLTTRMPDGSRGFSFLAIFTVEDFAPLDLGLGFRLTGVGGLFGYDRTVSMDALEAGLKSHALDRIMFPPDPVANAPAIVSTAGAVFPPARDQLIVGLMAQIAWGAEALVTIELGLIFELPLPGRLIILGKLRATFPHKRLPVVRINVEVIGEIDFERKRAFAHAVLVESKLAGFPMNGAAALLLRWGDDPVFVLAFGGVNKRYEHRLPTGFPKLERLSVALTRGDNPKLRLEAYVAVTSNSFQIGGKLELFASKGKFSIEGVLAVDALFQSGEPSVIFDLFAKLQLKAWGVSLFTVKFEGSLEGWHPSHVKGKATFEIWIFDYSVSVDHTFGSAAPPPQLPTVDVRAQLLAALGDPRSWQAVAPDTRASLVTLRPSLPTSDLQLHPLGRLAVSQRLVPLGMTIDRVGNARPSGGARFNIDTVSVSGSLMTKQPVTEQFARAEFFDMSDDEKLSAPPFESMPSGVEIGSGTRSHGPGVESTTEYETLIYGAPGSAPTPGSAYVLTASRLTRLAELSTTAPKFRAAGKPVKIAWSRYAVASTDDLTETAVPGVDPGGARTYSEAVSALRAHTAAHPEQQDRLQLVVKNG